MTFAERIITEWGQTVLVTLQTEENHDVRIFIPINLAEAFTDRVIDEINNSVKEYKLIYRRLANSCVLLMVSNE